MKKTLQECKEIVAIKHGYPNWDNVIANFFGTEDLCDLANKMYYEQSEVVQAYAKEQIEKDRVRIKKNINPKWPNYSIDNTPIILD